MTYWVYGRDAASGEPARRIYSRAMDESGARAEAESHGMLVEAIHEARGEERGDTPPITGFYEFTLPQNATIASLARYMRLAGIALVTFGVVQLAAGVLAARNAPGLFVQGTVSLVLGALSIGIAARFRRIVDSRGRDIGHLMDALGGLRLMYAIQVWTIAIAIVLIAGVVLYAKLS